MQLSDVANDDSKFFFLFKEIAIIGKFLPPKVPPERVAVENRVRVVFSVIGSALTVALFHAGWKIETNPGEEVYAIKDRKRLEPFQIFPKLVKKELSTDEWQQTCSKFGISDLTLGNIS